MTTWKRFCYRILGALLGIILPNKGRRLVFLTTLCIELSNQTTQNRRMLVVINKHLRLCKDTRSLLLPACLQRYVWRDSPLAIDFSDIDAVIHPPLTASQRLRGVIDVVRHGIDDDDQYTLLSEEELDQVAQRAINKAPRWAGYADSATVLTDVKEAIKVGLAFRNNTPWINPDDVIKGSP